MASSTSTWSGSVSIKANTTITFFSVDKSGKPDEQFKTISLSKPVNFTVSGVKQYKSGNGVYIKTCASIINALKSAASNADSITRKAIDTIANKSCYMQVTSSMTSKQTSTPVRDVTFKPKYESGTMKLKVGANVYTWSSPGGHQTGVIRVGTAKTSWLEFDVKNAVYSTSNGYKYVQISAGIKERIRSKTGTNVNVGDWICIDGSTAKIDNAKVKEQKATYAKANTDTSGDANNASDETESSITSATIDLKSGANKVDLETNSTLNDLMSGSMQGIFGIPYQWMDIADRRIDGSEFGRKYAEKIAARMPLLFLTPCRPAFLSGASKSSKNNLLATLFKGDTDVTANVLDSLLGDVKSDGVSRYYTANFAYAEYYRYVDACCQVTAKLLHLDGSKGSVIRTYGVRVGGHAVNDFSTFNWSKALKKGFTDYFSAASAIPFYINANVSVSESLSNDTMESSLAGTVKSKSEQAKELSFLLNTASSASGGGIISSAVNGLEELSSKFTNNASAANFITSVGNSMASIAAGGSMMFPELWSSSSMGRSYQIDIKLRSPDGDSLSVYLNVLVPLYHLLCLAAPQMMKDNYNIYYSPFLVKAYCKSMFNIDMGIITSMDISKGKEGDWNANGLPTSIDVSITIKDLYDVFSLTPYEDKIDLTNPLLDLLGKGDGSGAKRIVRNTSMMDYLCNNAGLNLNQNEVTRQATIYKMLRINTITNWPNNKWLQLQETVDNGLAKIYRAGAKNRK